MLPKFQQCITGRNHVPLHVGHWPAYLALFVIPLITIVMGFLVRGYVTPYYAFHHDPDYAYLFNGVSILSLVAPEYTDHPGTPVQILVAILLKFMHPLESVPDIFQNVLQDPEKHLVVVSNVFLVVVAGSVFAAGAYVYKTMGSVALALIVQSPPLASAVLMHSLPRVIPEPILLALSMIVAILLAALVWGKPGLESSTYARPLGLVSGLGVATKLTFLPLLVVPLLAYHAWVDRKRFLIFALIGFAVATSPMVLTLSPLAEYRQFAKWAFNIFMGAGIYGQGPKTIIDIHLFAANLWQIVLDQPLYMLVVGISVVVFLIGFWRSRRDRGSAEVVAMRLLGGIVAMHLLMIAMFAKHYQSTRYLTAALGLAGFTVVLAYTIVARWWKASRWFRPICFATAAGVSLVLAIPVWGALDELQRFSVKKKDLLATVDREIQSQYSRCAWVDQDSATKEFAVAFGLEWSRQTTTTKRVRDRYFEGKKLYTYNPYNKLYMTMQGTPISLEQIKRHAPCVILRESDDGLKVL